MTTLRPVEALLQMRHIVDYKAPVVLHPILLKKYYPYLDDDASGHFQVGRGYDKRQQALALGYFEPWNQQRFDPSEPYIDRVQWRTAYKFSSAPTRTTSSTTSAWMRRTTRYRPGRPRPPPRRVLQCRAPAGDRDPRAEQQSQRDRGHTGRCER